MVWCCTADGHCLSASARFLTLLIADGIDNKIQTSNWWASFYHLPPALFVSDEVATKIQTIK